MRISAIVSWILFPQLNIGSIIKQDDSKERFNSINRVFPKRCLKLVAFTYLSFVTIIPQYHGFHLFLIWKLIFKLFIYIFCYARWTKYSWNSEGNFYITLSNHLCLNSTFSFLALLFYFSYLKRHLKNITKHN